MRPRTGNAGLRRVTLLAALLAFVWQSYVVHSHVHLHAALAASTSASQSDGPLLAGDDAPAAPPTTCAICQEIAHAGVFLLPDAVMPIAPAATALLSPPAFALGAAVAGRSHAWHSRAPPLLLSA